MNRKHKTKILCILCIFLSLSFVIALILYSLKQNINLFFTPSELKTTTINAKRMIRVGGYVKKGSVYYDDSGQAVQFVITDRKSEIPVSFNGVLPNLFREEQTVVITGRLDAPNHIHAETIFAKHDEKYMPKTLKNKL